MQHLLEIKLIDDVVQRSKILHMGSNPTLRIGFYTVTIEDRNISFGLFYRGHRFVTDLDIE